jgi:DNA-binding CsgD family transcriptional regulator
MSDRRFARHDQCDELPVNNRAFRSTSRAPDVLTDAQWHAIVAALQLSNREAELVRQSCYDDSVSAIAAGLRISPHTVRTHRERLYRKLQVNSPCQVLSVCFAAHVVLEGARSGGEIDEAIGQNQSLKPVKTLIKADVSDSRMSDTQVADLQMRILDG